MLQRRMLRHAQACYRRMVSEKEGTNGVEKYGRGSREIQSKVELEAAHLLDLRCARCAAQGSLGGAEKTRMRALQVKATEPTIFSSSSFGLSWHSLNNSIQKVATARIMQNWVYTWSTQESRRLTLAKTIGNRMKVQRAPNATVHTRVREGTSGVQRDKKIVEE